MEELLEKIPVENRWAITAKILGRFLVMRGEKLVAPDLGKTEGFISPLLSVEKWKEITTKPFVEGAEGTKQVFQQMKEMFEISVEDAIGAANLVIVFAVLVWGPELEWEYIEKTPERVVVRYTKCPLWDRYKEYEVESFAPCDSGHQIAVEEGLKAVNPKLT